MWDERNIDTSILPKSYLESYPYPALVLLVPIRPVNNRHQDDEDLLACSQTSDHITPFTSSGPGSLKPFEVVWANEKWSNLTQGQPLMDCIDVLAARNLGMWLAGVKVGAGDNREDMMRAAKAGGVRIADPVRAEGAAKNIDPRADAPALRVEPHTSRAPEDSWACEHAYEDHSGDSDRLSSSDLESTGIELEGGQHPGSATVTIELVSPGRVKLELTKAMLPVTRIGKGGLKATMNTHSFAIITTTPRSAFIPNSSQASPTSSLKWNNFRVKVDMDSLSLAIPKATLISPRTPTLPLGDSSTSSVPPRHDPTPPFPEDELKNLSISFEHRLSKQRTPTVDSRANRSSVARIKGSAQTSVDLLMETTDWAKTPLGPREQWPQSLVTMVGLTLNYPHQACIWWGEKLTMIYNEPYARVNQKHPNVFGMSGPVSWSEVWNCLGPLAELVLNGTPVWKEDDFLLLKDQPGNSKDIYEEYCTWMWVPVLQEDGSFGGLWNTLTKTTSKVMAERRMATVREMGQRISIARTMGEFDAAVIEVLDANPKDVPFAALYRVQEAPSVESKAQDPSVAELTNNSDNQQHGVQVDVTLVGSVGVPSGHSSAPKQMTFPLSQHRPSSTAFFCENFSTSPTLSTVSASASNSAAGTFSDGEGRSAALGLEHWPIRQALQCRRLVLVEDIAELVENYPIRIWDELPNAAVVVPISNDSDKGIPSAVLVLGLNIRRPFDDDYESFINNLRLQLASGIAAVRSYETERQRIDELAAIDRAKSLLLSNVSHELRTPLTLVSGPIDDLLQETKQGHKREMLIMARRNLRRLSRLVSTLMDVSRLEAGRLKGVYRPVNLGIMTRDLAVLFKAAIEKANLKYLIEVDTAPENVFVDHEHWEKIVFNLIGNAMKYTMVGYVRVSLHYSNDQAILTIADSGVGIPRSDIKLIGERFHRVPSVSRSHEGTGIGLALTKELINLHGGTLETKSVTSEESQDGSHGSTFTVKIPIGSDHLTYEAIDHGEMPNKPQPSYGQGLVDEAMQWIRDSEGSSATSSDDNSLMTGDQPHGGKAIDPNTLYFQEEDVIMLVEDSSDTRRYMKSIFSQYCRIVEARDGAEALEMCHQNLPDLIISDVMMPRMGGFELLAGLKEGRETRVIPVIMLTARGTDESKVSGIMAGADDYLAKPFNAREIVARAHMQLQLGKKRRHLEEAFEKHAGELRALAEYAPVGIFRTDVNGDITFVNDAWYEISSFPRNQPVVNWIEILMNEDEQDYVRSFWNNVLTGTEVSQAGDFQYQNGRWFAATIIRLDLVQSGLTGMLGCVTDITERKAHEDLQLQQVKEAEQRRLDAEEAKRQQELLIDITSHEIRNPISSVMQISLLDFASTNLLSLQEQLQLSMTNQTPFVPTRQLMNNIEEDLDALESIYQCGLTQERISNDVLSLGRIQLDMLQMCDVEFDAAQEAHNVLLIFQNEARMKRISLTFNVGESHAILGLKSVKADLVRLNQITTNLLSNAIRFTATSNVRHIKVQADISFDPPASGACVMPRKPIAPKEITEDMPIYLYLSVEDSGPGLSPEEMDKLFRRFSQVSPKIHTIFGGSGLGLFVCRKIAELMGGGIDVESEKGKGSTFRFYIKAKACKVSALSKKDLRSKSQSRSNSQAKFSGMGRNPHVLIVEDNLINQTVLARQLKHCNLTCDVANNGLEGLEKIRKVSSVGVESDEQRFDCVLMDLEMPVMDGLTAVRHIREEEKAGKLKKNLVIALTGNARQGQIDAARASGMDEVVIKPYRLDDLLQKIEQIMKSRADEEESLLVEQ